MAMLPFCGYNMADYWNHWLQIGEQENAQLPRIFYVNWFRKDDEGKFIWPGFGENSRVLKWVFERCEKDGNAVSTPIGNLPGIEDLDFAGLELNEAEKANLLRVDVDGWLQEIPLIEEYYSQFGERLPAAFKQQLDRLRQDLEAAKQNAA